MGQYKAHRKADPSTVASGARRHPPGDRGRRSPTAAADHLAYHLEQAQNRLLTTSATVVKDVT